jgi:hypothetical protein
MDTVKLNQPMPDGNKCPQCGTPLPAGALAGLCPACLLKQGVSDETATGGQAPPFQPPPVAELAPLFPQLEILELIGKGGMGAVYKARQKELDRIVALKILPPGIGRDAAFAGRFAREAKALAKLNHPGIVTLYEFGHVGGEGRAGSPLPAVGDSQPSTFNSQPLYYFLMEFVDGVNLRQLLHAGRIAPREALAIVPQICDALQFAHDQGIVHRGSYAQSWTDAAAYFQSAIISEKWVRALQQARQPLGSLVSRKLRPAQELTSLPGAPDGSYIVMQFETSFANKKSAIETVTFMLEKDGQWRAAGYYIK